MNLCIKQTIKKQKTNKFKSFIPYRLLLFHIYFIYVFLF